MPPSDRQPTSAPKDSAPLDAGGQTEVLGPAQDRGESLRGLVFSASEDMELTPGTVVAERYRVLSQIGSGAMGAVYLAEHLTVGRRVAVKVLLGEWSAVPEVADRFAAEARTASSIGHPGIVDVLDAGCLDDGRLYLVMEYLEGHDLGVAIEQRGPYPPVEACQLIRRVAEAICAAHAAGVVHRDLKPDNIIVVEREGRTVVKVLDFGVASNHGPKVGAATTPGAVIGTPSHMSPEQALGEAAGPDFDIYALGSILFTLLVGHPPFDDPNPLKVLGLKQTTAAPAIDDLRSGLPASLRELIDDTLALDRERRPPSVELFIDRLDHALVAVEAAQSGAKTGSGHRWYLSVLLGGAVLALGLVLLWLASDDGSTPSQAVPSPDTAGVKTSEAERGGRAGAPIPAQVSSSETEPPTGSGPTESGSTESGSTGSGSGSTDSGSTGSAGSGAGGASPPTTAAAQASPKVADRGSTRTPTKVSAEHLTERCGSVREQARLARDAYRWASLLELAKQRSCWAKRRDARKLEVQARMETGDFSGCISAAANIQDPEVIRWRDLCRKRNGQ